ncbi:MAG: protein kinase, partial [Planctomycetales bacterium]|nr:protein kinase [Planctomycetales bacterium]
MASDPAPVGCPGPRGASAFLADFGLAKAVATGSRLTRTGIALGTPAYMSPEQAHGETSALAAATDVWSLGCVLYELLAGRPPFVGADAAAVVAQVLLREPAPVQAARGDVPRALERVLAGSLAKRASARYRDGGALREDLDRVIQGERPRGVPRSLRAPPAVLLLALLVGSGAAVALARAGPRPPAPVPAPPAEDPDLALVRQARARRPLDPREAADLLGKLRSPRRDDRALRRERADCWREAGEWRLAGEEYTRLLDEDPSDLEAAFGRGVARWVARAAHDPSADSEGSDLARAGRGLPDARGALARGLLAHDKGRTAESERELAAAGDGWEACAARALVFHARGESDAAVQQRAEREFSRAIEQGPAVAWIRNERAHARFLIRDWSGAVEDYTETLRLRPGRPELFANRASARFERRDFAGAIEDADRALTEQPSNAMARYVRGHSRYMTGDLRGALGDLDECLRLEPGRLPARVARSWVRRDLGDRPGQCEDADEAVRSHPDAAAAWTCRGRARGEAGNPAGAIADSTEALRLDPDRTDARANRATAKLLAGDPSGAEADATAVLEREPRNTNALAVRASARRELGNPAAACADFEALLSIRPGDA